MTNQNWQIAKNAQIVDTKLESDNVIIADGVKMNKVHVKAEKLVVDEGAELSCCKLFSNGIIKIGKKAVIKEDAIINAFNGITIGERTLIDRNVFVGGMQSEKSEIIIGNDCALLYRAYLNPTRKIILGDNVGIGGYSLVFTHSAWQNILDGHPNKFAEVKISNNVWIPWNVTILPGVTIGKNALIGTGSVVTKSIPANSFAVGIPAKVKHIKKTSLSETQKNRLVLEILQEFHGFAENFLKLPNTINKGPNYAHIVFGNSRLVYNVRINKEVLQKNDIAISFVIPDPTKQQVPWIEFDSLTSKVGNSVGCHFISFVRRYGIRLKNSIVI